MTEYIERATSNAAIREGSVPLEAVLRTEELHRRPSRPPDYNKENRALVTLAVALADTPRAVLQTLADTMLEVFEAGSSGISLLTKEDGGKRFYWPAIAGKWKGFVGGGTPRDFSPCGDVLDRNTTLLFGHLARRYTYFEPVTPAVEEALLAPFYVAGKAVGTIWAVAHDNRRFDAEDERLMNSLGKFASSAYQVLESLDALTGQADQARKSEQAAALLAAIVDSSDDAIVSKSLNGVITTWNNSAERLFGYSANEAVGQHINLIVPTDRRDEEAQILARLRKGERIEHFETIRVCKDGTLRDISLTISPVKDGAGRTMGASKVARDITERKQVERTLRKSQEQLRELADSLESQVELRTRELQRRNAEVLEQTDELRELSRRLQQTQDEERRRIARDLHDSAGQIITALGMSLASITRRAGSNAEISKTAEEGHEMVRQLSKEIRTLSYLLHPPLLDETGLSDAIQWYMQGLAERSGLKIELDIPKNFGRLPEDMEVAIFRIMQECLTNIHRHSGSKTAAIRLSRNAGNVYMEIQDDGTGMSAEKLAALRTQHSGVGITGMRERVRHLKGAMDIQSNPKGTKISVTFPVFTAQPIPEIVSKQAGAGR